MTNLELARRALYLARLASADTYVGRQARRLMRECGMELDLRGVTALEVVALVRAAKQEKHFPECFVCGESKPVAAYGGWCCTKAMNQNTEAVASY